MKVLALETASQPGSVACWEEGDVRFAVELPASQRTTETFALQLQRALEAVSWRPSDVELLAVSQGPGSFTGLRIGITVAKVFAYATRCQVTAVDTLLLLAAQYAQCTATPGGHVWSVMDAQRKELFVRPFDCHRRIPQPLGELQIVDAATWFASLPPGSIVTGSGLKRWNLAEYSQVQVSLPVCWNPQAAALARLAAELHGGGMRTDPWQLTPAYHRLSAAEEKQAEKRQQEQRT